MVTPEDDERVRAATRTIAQSENMFGGGFSSAAIHFQVSRVKKLLLAKSDPDVGQSLLEAAGNLGSVAAFAAFDVGDHELANDHFSFALWCAKEANSWPLRANVLAEMSRKSLYLGKYDEALSLIEFAQVRQDRVSDTARAMLFTLRARTLALTGRQREAADEVRRADESFAGRDGRLDPPWLCYYDEAEHLGSTARAPIPAARHTGRTQAAADRLWQAIELHTAGYPRSRTFSRTRLATLLMAAGDPHEAADIGTRALADALRSDRVVAEMRQLARTATTHADIAAVAELREGIAALPQPAHAVT